MKSDGILSDLKVVELASVLAGPSVGLFLAEMGAQVVKIENPNTGGDTTRKWKTPLEDKSAGVSSYYACANWSKEVQFLDIRIESDLGKLLQLITDADVLLLNFKPGDEKRYHLDYDSLSKINPRLIVGEIFGFPNEERPAFDIVLQAETGLMSLNGEAGSQGLKWPLPIVDILAAHQLKEGILLALLHRAKTGRGGCVSVSLFDAAVASLFNIGTNVLMGGSDPKSIGPLHPNIAPYGETLLTSDNHIIVLAAGTDAQFDGLSRILGFDDQFRRNFSTNQVRVQRRSELGEMLFKSGRKFTLDELIKGLTSQKVPFGRVRTVKSVLDQLPPHYFLNEVIEGVETRRMRSAIFTFRS